MLFWALKHLLMIYFIFIENKITRMLPPQKRNSYKMSIRKYSITILDTILLKIYPI